jgi:hypothetical protein
MRKENTLYLRSESTANTLISEAQFIQTSLMVSATIIAKPKRE